MMTKPSLLISTKRLQLRPTHANDFANILALRSDPDVQKYTLQGVQTRKDIQRFFDTVLPYKQKHGIGMSSVFINNTNEFIGQAGLFHIGHYDLQNEIELGFRFHKKYWNNGYATEISLELLNWAKKYLSVPEIIAFVETENIASRRVLEKIGMHYYNLVDCYYGRLEKYLYPLSSASL